MAGGKEKKRTKPEFAFTANKPDVLGNNRKETLCQKTKGERADAQAILEDRKAQTNKGLMCESQRKVGWVGNGGGKKDLVQYSHKLESKGYRGNGKEGLGKKGGTRANQTNPLGREMWW